VNLEQRSGEEAFHLQHGFVGFDFKEDVPLGDRVAFLFEPLDNGGFLDSLAHFGHDDSLRHNAVSLSR